MAKRNNYSKDARKDASKGNYQDAFAEKEKAKGSKGKGMRNNSGTKSVPVDCKSSDNDPQWYTPSQQLLKDACSFNFGMPTGRPIPMNPQAPMPSSKVGPVISDPGIMVLRYLPTVGDTSSPNSPVNTAMNALFQAVRNKTSGTSYYEGSDLMLAIIGMAGAYAYYAWMVRLYGIACNFDMLNHYTPQALVNANAVNFDNLQSNLSNFRAYINRYAYRLASFALPNNFNFVKRAIFMNENIYMDSSSKRAQYYMYVPYGFWTYLQDSSTGDYRVEITALPAYTGGSTTNMTVQQLISYGDALLNPLFQSEDLRFMTADILKAFGEGGLFKPLPIAETYQVVPVHNSEVLSQIENATVLPPIMLNTSGIISGISQWRISQTKNNTINTDYLTATYKYNSYYVLQDSANKRTLLQTSYTYAYNYGNGLVNFHGIDSPTPEQVMVATRLKLIGGATFTNATGGGPLATEVTVGGGGSEVIVGASLYYVNVENAYTYDHIEFSGLFPMLTTDTKTQMKLLSQLSKFDWHPQVQIVVIESDGSEVAYMSDLFWDFDNFCLISKAELRNINYVAELGLFASELPNMR